MLTFLCFLNTLGVCVRGIFLFLSEEVRSVCSLFNRQNDRTSFGIEF
jgi:hypothetical protein